MALNAKQQRFVEEYLVDLNATQAAIRAGYSAKTAEQTASRLLRNVQVQEAIQAGRERQSKATQIDARRVLEEFAAVAMCDIGDILDFTGDQPKLRPARDIPERARRAISSVKVKRYTEGKGDDALEVEVTEFRLWPKLDALKEVAARVEVAQPIRVDVTTGGKPIESANTLTAADIVAAARLVGMARGDVHPDGGPQPVDP